VFAVHPRLRISTRRCFDQIDLDRGGTLDLEELGQAFMSMGETVTDADLLEVVRMVDENDNGEVEFEEFISMISLMRSGKCSIRLKMLLSLLPDGNEVSQNARARLDAFCKSLKWASVRCALHASRARLHGSV
jgi:hypothetical protein